MEHLKKHTLQVLAVLSGMLLVFSISAALVLNSGLLNRWAKQQAVELFNNELMGHLELDRVELKFPNRVSITEPRIYEAGSVEPALAARRISAKLNFLLLLQPRGLRNLHFSGLWADSLRVRAIERQSGKLNLALIFTSRNPDSTKSGMEAFSCGRLALRRSAVSYTPLEGKSLAAEGLRIRLSSFSIKKNLLKGSVETLSFSIPDENFTLKEGTGKVFITDRRAEVINMKAASGKSRAALSVSLDGINLFAMDSMKALSTGTSFVNIEEVALDQAELVKLIPSISLPAGLYSLKGNLKGNLEKAEALDLRLWQNASHIAAKGELLNLGDTDALAYRLKIDSSKVSATLLEALGGKIAGRSGGVKFTGSVEGSLKGVKGALGFETEVGTGSIQATVAAAQNGSVTYRGTLDFQDLMVDKLLGITGVQSRLQGRGSFEGLGGQGAEKLKAEVMLKESLWMQQPIESGTMRLEQKGKQLKVAAAMSGEGRELSIEGQLDTGGKEPRYSGDGKMKGIDMARLMVTSPYPTNLNGKVALEGTGFELGTLNAKLHMQFAPSSINGVQLNDGSHLKAELAQSTGSSSITVESDIADLSLKGNYSVEQLIALGAYAARGAAREVARENIWEKKTPTIIQADPLLKQPFTLSYRLAVKESAPLALVLPIGDTRFRGTAEGRAVSEERVCSISSFITLTSLTTPESQGGIAIKNLEAEGSLKCTGSGISGMNLKGRAERIQGKGRNTGPGTFAARYTPSSLGVSLDFAIAEPRGSITAEVETLRRGSSYLITLNRLALTDSSGSWEVEGTPRVQVERTLARFNRFTLAKGPQKLTLQGELGSNSPGSFTLALKAFQLTELQRLLLDPSLAALSGTLNASLSLSGPSSTKTSTLQLNGSGVQYDRFRIGTLNATARHRGRTLSFSMRSRSGENEVGSTGLNTITGEGSVPLSLNYFPLKAEVPPNQRINAQFHSDNLSAQVLEFALPFFASAEGQVPTTLRIEGRTPSPDIYLTSSLRNTKIRVAPTEVAYTLNGEVVITPRQLELRGLQLRDSLNGTGTISGILKLKNLQPGELSVDARVNRLLLYNKNDNKDETSFGTIVGTSNGMRLRGTLEAPVLEGELRVNSATFSLYRSGANESAKYIGAEKFITFVPRYPQPIKAGEDKNAVQPKDAKFYYSLIDILQITDFKLSGNEPMRYTMIFDRVRGEQLETTVNNLSFVINKHNRNYRLFGSVNIIEGKYRFSNSNFDLEDGGRISWNSSEIRDGAITNLYGSKFVSALYQPTAERDNVKLLLAITGTINEPRVAMGYYLNEQSQPYAAATMLGSQSAQVDPNAELNVISMLLSKQWYIRPGSNGTGGNGGGIAASSVGISAGTGLLSAQVSNAIRNLAGLESFNLNVGSGRDGALSGLDLYFALNVPGTGGKVRFIGTGSSSDLSQSSLFGEYGTSQKIEYRITPKVSAEAYRSYGQNSSELISTNLQKPTETWGVSLSYKERFHTWDQFWNRLTGKSKSKPPQPPQ
ncbi:MAG: translocation/assembly module TamB [Chlorobium sp.]|nr:translocation/assembly module TamB [Chlorobium sp.]